MDEWLWPGLAVAWSGGSAALTLFQRAIRHSDGRPWFTAASYVPAGTLGVASLRDWNDATHLAGYMGAPGTEAPVPTSNPAVFNGAPTIAFTSHMYQSNRPAADWDFSCDGVDSEKWNVFVANDVINVTVVMCTRALGIGTQVYFIAGGPVDYLEGAAGGLAVGSVAYGPPLVAGDQVVLSGRYKAADANQYELRQNGVLNASGVYGAAPGVPAAAPLTIGAWATGTHHTQMDWAGTFFTTALDASARADIDAWIAAGMPTP